MRILALIMARSGSKGLKHKNVRRVGGVPLLTRAVHLALASRRKGEQWTTVVSTDSPGYARMARAAGAETPFLRPKRLASDAAPLATAVLDALDTLTKEERHFDAVVLLSATTPLTLPKDVRGALALWRHNPNTSVISVVAAPAADSWRMALRKGRLVAKSDRPPGRRQQEKESLILNGAIYVASPRWVALHKRFFVDGRTLPYTMPKLRSLDIEDADDLRLAEAFLKMHRY